MEKTRQWKAAFKLSHNVQDSSIYSAKPSGVISIYACYVHLFVPLHYPHPTFIWNITIINVSGDINEKTKHLMPRDLSLSFLIDNKQKTSKKCSITAREIPIQLRYSIHSFAHCQTDSVYFKQNHSVLTALKFSTVL